MKTTEHHCSTAHVRPIADVIAELRPKLMTKLPGSPALAASWSVLNECAETIESNATVAEITGEQLPDYSRWIAAGETRLASTVIRKMADVFKVPVMDCDQQ
jgi:hypothetical protein